MQEKRRLRNVSLTRKYHWPYLGKVTLVSVAMVPIIYGYVLGHMMVMRYLDPDFPYQTSAGILSAGALVVCALIVYLGILTAHRVAGPFLQLRDAFEQISAGDLGVRLQFRQGDRLEDVEEAFNRMMDTLQARVEGEGQAT